MIKDSGLASEENTIWTEWIIQKKKKVGRGQQGEIYFRGAVSEKWQYYGHVSLYACRTFSRIK